MASRFDEIINKLWQSDEDRAIARTFVERFDVPGMSDRLPALLQEAANTADRIAAGEITMEDGRSFLGDFAQQGLGIQPHHMADLTSWFDNTGAEVVTAEPPTAEPDKLVAEQPPAQPAQAQRPLPAAASPAPPASAPVRSAGPSREQLQADVAKWESAMRSPEKSEPWRDYWHRGGQSAYLSALQALESADAAPPPTPAVDEAVSAPAQTQTASVQ